MIHNLPYAAICGATPPSQQVAVILSRQHSGTNFLSSVLQRLPDTVMGGELFLNKGPCYLWLNGTQPSLALEAIRGQRVIHGPPDAISDCLKVSQVASGTDAQRLLLRSKRVGFTWQANQANSPLKQCSYDAITPNGRTNNCNSANVEFLRAAKVLLLRRDNPLAFRMAASNRKESYTEHGLTPPNVDQNVTFTSEMLADIDRMGQRTRSCYRDVAQALQRCGVDVMELSYEQLNLNHQSFVRVLSFLGEKANYSNTEKLLQGTDSRWHFSLSDSGKHHVNGPVAYLNPETTRLFGSMLEEGRFEYLRYCHLFDNCTIRARSTRS